MVKHKLSACNFAIAITENYNKKKNNKPKFIVTLYVQKKEDRYLYIFTHSLQSKSVRISS